MLVDPNFNGSLGLRELRGTLRQVREALRKQAKEKREAKNPFLAKAAAGSTGDEQIVHVFGVKAFTECLLKIGIGYLSFHGSVEQSELPTHAKVMWLLSYLSWRFERHKAEERVVGLLCGRLELVADPQGEQQPVMQRERSQAS